MEFGIKKCATMVIRPNTPLFSNKKDPVSNFLRNPKILMPFKKIILNSIVISRVSYFAPLLGSNKSHSRKASDYLKLCYEYPEYSYGFYWLLKARSGYKLDARVAKAAIYKFGNSYYNFIRKISL
jgi:hypothetical protein